MNYGLICLATLPTFWVNSAMAFIARRLLSLPALQFVTITHCYASMRLSKDKKRYTLSTSQLRFLEL
jgi:hypothetical protein